MVIAKMIQLHKGYLKKLSEGYDFVQCSRFLKEGKGVNTPKLREIAIRFIHAPVL